MSDTKPYADLKVKIRTYKDKDGNDKNVWLTIGTLFASEHFNNMFITLDAVPYKPDGVISVFKRENKNENKEETNSNDVDF